MVEVKQKQQKILDLLLKHPSLSSSRVHNKFSETGEQISLVTIKRELSRMAMTGLVHIIGKGRSRIYEISVLGRMLSKVDASVYCSI